MILKKNKITKISIVILMFLLLFFSVKYFKVQDEFTQFKANTELEIQILESQLGEILHKYDSLSEESKQNTKLLAISVDSQSISEYSKIRNSKETSKIDDSIVTYAKRVQELNAKIAHKTQSLSKKSNILPLTEHNPYRLSVSNINAKGVKIYSDLYNSFNTKIQQLRVCYTLQKSNILKAGSRKIYIQVVNPKKQIISKGNFYVENALGAKLQYSAFSEVNYEKKGTDVCAYVDLEKNKTIKGKYIINIYSDFAKIGSTTFEYK